MLSNVDVPFSHVLAIDLLSARSKKGKRRRRPEARACVGQSELSRIFQGMSQEEMARPAQGLMFRAATYISSMNLRSEWSKQCRRGDAIGAVVSDPGEL